jgi:hypothetical protein
MRRRLKIYLSHPPDLRHEIKEWTKELEEKLHVRIYNPFYNVRALRATLTFKILCARKAILLSSNPCAHALA